MTHSLTRRQVALLSAGAACALARPVSARQVLAGLPSFPIRSPDHLPGDSFHVRHGFACENTWFQPGWLHTGEDWYAIEDAETGGADVIAVSAGTVVFAGSDYPGRVVILKHDGDLYSMYGHLEFDLAVADGDEVTPGQRLGSVLTQVDRVAPSHLHFEMRRFLFAADVNGDAPRYDVDCGVQCAPGPGYWPIDAPEHPAAIGWRNPTHQIAALASAGELPRGARTSVSRSGDGREIECRTQPDAATGDTLLTLQLVAGNIYPLLEVRGGDPASTGTSAEAYDLWFRIGLEDGADAWVSAIETSSRDTGSDGKPSGIDFLFVLAV